MVLRDEARASSGSGSNIMSWKLPSEIEGARKRILQFKSRGSSNVSVFSSAYQQSLSIEHKIVIVYTCVHTYQKL